MAAPTDLSKHFADQIKTACLSAAREGFEDAQLSGLCAEGCIEAALSAIQMVDTEALLARLQAGDSND